MLRHLFVLGRDLVVPPEGLSFTLDRHLARGEQIEILRDRRRPPSDPPNPQSLSGRERRRASPLAEQLRVHGFAIFSRQEEPTRRTVAAGAAPPMPPPLVHPPLTRPSMTPPPFTPPPVPPRAPVPPAPPPVAEWRSPFQDVVTERDARRPPRHDPRPEPRREPRFEPHGRARPFARPSLDDDAAEDFGVVQDEEEVWPAARPAPRGGRLVALVLVLLVLAVAGSFYLARQWDLAQRAETEPARTASADRHAATGPAAAQDPAPPTAPSAAPVPSPASAPEAATPVPASAATRAPEAVASRPAAEAPRSTRSSTPAPEPAARERVAAELPSRPSMPPRRAEEPSEPALPPMRRLPSFAGLPHVQIGRAAGADGTTFTVRLSDPAGRPLSNAQVSLRQTLGDGSVRETPLEAVSPPGSYRGAVPGAVRRGEQLALRVDLGNRRVEMPVTE